MLEIVRNDSSPPLNKTALSKRHHFVTDNDMIQYPDISMDGVTENCSCIFCTSHILVGRMLEIVRNDSSPPLNKTALGKRHHFVTDDDMIQYPDIDHT